MTHAFQVVLVTSLLTIVATTSASDDSVTLWYDRPAEQWTDALPVGNGRMGAMVFGGVEVARWQFNEDSVWTGGPHSYAHEGAAEYLPQLRELLFAGKQREAEELAMQHFMSVPLGQMAYQPCGDVTIEFADTGELSDYRRDLNLDTATTTTTYARDGVRYTRRTYASYPDQAIVIELACDHPGKLNFTAELTSPHEHAETKAADERTLLLSGRVRDVTARSGEHVPGQVKFASHLRLVDTDGEVRSDDDALEVSEASRATLVLTARTNVLNFRDVSGDAVARSANDMEAASQVATSELHRRHLKDHQELFRRVSLEIGSDKGPALPTDRRVLAAKERIDPALAALFFQYGRYLMIASSRPAGQPANLQGLWNDQLKPSWDSKYTVNINTEMNYWVTDSCNLAECAEPLYAALAEVAESGRETARVHYGAPGWVLHHNFDLWRGTVPINHANHGIWPTGGAWLCQHLWWRYLYSGDEEFLRETAYPLMKGAAQFFAYYLVEDPRDDRGWLISGPSNSPEQGGLVMGPTMDHQIIRYLFASTFEASEILGVDSEFRERLRGLHDRTAPNQIGQHGQLQEWLEDMDDPQNQHRHVSHLWALHPGSEITPDMPDLFAAARQTLEYRGDEGTGWSRGWKINFWARLRNGDRALTVLDGLLTLTGSRGTDYRGGGVYANLFDAHPPFQIDGNFGATAGIAEMLVQSHRANEQGTRIVELLPALPTAWPDGQVTGLRTRGGYEIDLTWRDGKLEDCRVTSHWGQPIELRYGDHRTQLELVKGMSTRFDGKLSHAVPQ